MDSDDDLTLSSTALDALKAFYAERDEHTKRFAELQSAAEARAAPEPTPDKPLTMALFQEDWNESQFWYTDATATAYARRLLDGATADSLVAVVSAPSVFVQLKNLVAGMAVKPQLLLLEHDHRFGVFREFVFYDFKTPTKLPAELRGRADRLIVDPPFLSEECQTRMALTARWLATPDARVLVSTGERMGELVTQRLYAAQGVRTTTFDPDHGGRLSNEFRLYANFASPDWTWAEADTQTAQTGTD